MITLKLEGTPYERGLQQAAVDPALRKAALSWMALRHDRMQKNLGSAATLTLARDLHAYALKTVPDAMEELRGLADGFGMAPFDLFCGWHTAVLGEVHAAYDGCTAVATSSRGRAHVVKNRDVPGETQRLQTVFRMMDPSWRGGGVLGVSILGSSPCASSGINEAGLCVTDTQIATNDHGVGLVRYIVMQKLLQDCRNVPEALAMIKATRHAGGGSLVMADAQGAIAAVELGHRVSDIDDTHRVTLVRTNHFIGAPTAAANFVAADAPLGVDSRARLTQVDMLINQRNGCPPPGEIVTLLSNHDPDHPLCRHGHGVDQPTTISLVLYDTEQRSLSITDGKPCSSPSLVYRLEIMSQSESIT